MPTEVFLPHSLLAEFRRLFPTLDFNRIHFHEGLPTLTKVDSAPRAAVTIPSPNRTDVYLREYEPCGFETFRVLAHELVHALQVQSADNWFFFRIAYLTWQLGHGYRRGDGNCLEEEAYAYEDSVVAATSNVSPTTCLGRPGVPWMASLPLANPVYARVAAGVPTLTQTSCKFISVFRGNVFEKFLRFVGLLASIIANVGGAAGFGSSAAGIGTIIGTGIGLVVGGLAVLAFASGGMIGGLIGSFIGMGIGALVGAFVGGVIGGIIDWLGNLFGSSDPGGHLNVIFSMDRGASFQDKATLANTSYNTPSVSFDTDSLAIGWTGIDWQCWSVIIPERTVLHTERSGPSGMGVALAANNRLYVAWRGTDERPNVAWTTDGASLPGKLTLPSSGPRDSAPSIAVATEGILAGVYVAWVDGNLRIWVSCFNLNLRLRFVLEYNEWTPPYCSPAIALDENGLYLAFVGTEPGNNIHVSRRYPFPDRQPTPTVVLGEQCGYNTGPSLAFAQRRLHLAWKGTDGRLNYSNSSDQGQSFQPPTILNENSRLATGPGLAVHPAGGICLSWTGLT